MGFTHFQSTQLTYAPSQLDWAEIGPRVARKTYLTYSSKLPTLVSQLANLALNNR